MPASADEKSTAWAYGIGALVGFMMVLLFLLGYRVIAENHTIIGSIMVYGGLLLWPAYAVVTIILRWHARIDQKPWIQALVRSHLVVPVGSLIAVIAIAAVYRAFGGV